MACVPLLLFLDYLISILRIEMTWGQPHQAVDAELGGSVNTLWGRAATQRNPIKVNRTSGKSCTSKEEPVAIRQGRDQLAREQICFKGPDGPSETASCQQCALAHLEYHVQFWGLQYKTDRHKLKQENFKLAIRKNSCNDLYKYNDFHLYCRVSQCPIKYSATFNMMA